MALKPDKNSATVNNLGPHNMMKIHNSHLKFFYETPLYYKAGEGIGFELYKPPLTAMKDMRITNETYPESLFMHNQDKITGLKELQQGLNIQLSSDLKSNDPVKVQSTLVSLVEHTIKEPDIRTVEGAVDTMDVLFKEYKKNRGVIDKLVGVISKDYTTAVHSVNVMALTLRFCYFCGLGEDESKKLGLAAFLHDVGKAKISNKLLQAPRKLSESEFNIVKKHTVFGYDILKDCNLPDDVCLCALNHHERADGSGYPNGITEISEEAEIIAFIDCYEALTCNDRPYRDAATPFAALSHIKLELFRGHFKNLVFSKFVQSLG